MLGYRGKMDADCYASTLTNGISDIIGMHIKKFAEKYSLFSNPCCLNDGFAIRKFKASTQLKGVTSRGGNLKTVL